MQHFEQRHDRLREAREEEETRLAEEIASARVRTAARAAERAALGVEQPRKAGWVQYRREATDRRAAQGTEEDRAQGKTEGNEEAQEQEEGKAQLIAPIHSGSFSTWSHDDGIDVASPLTKGTIDN